MELKSAPPDGFVELRKMPYGRSLQRRDMAIRARIEQDKRGGDAHTVLDQYTQKTRQFEFEYCIVDHNLTDEGGAKLDFSNPMTLEVLDPAIGAEIEDMLDKLHSPAERTSMQNGKVVEGPEHEAFVTPSVES